MTLRLMPLRPLLLAAALTLGLSAQATDWKADPASSSLNYHGAVEGEGFTGQFKTFAPAIRFDPADLSNARFEVKVSLASADSANSDRDDTVQGEEFFSTKQFPEATYTATSFRDLGDGTFAADGTLSLRGVEKPVTLEFSFVQTGNQATLEGKTTLNRMDFNVGGGDWADASTIAHEVGVTTTLKLSAE